MLTQRSARMHAVLLLIGQMVFTGCLKDECRNTYTIYRPVFKSLSQARSEMKWEASKAIEHPGKIYLYGKYLLVNDLGKGIHVFDNSVPAAPKKLGFLRIWGNVDMAVRNNTLFADSYSDLAVIPIENWNTATPVTFRNKVFTDRVNFWNNTTNPDSVQVIVDYVRQDTVVDCETVNIWNNCPACMFADASGRNFAVSAAASSTNTNGVGGSMARFTLVDHYLYTVTNSALNTFDVSNTTSPSLVNSRTLGWNIETIYPFGNKLFIGSMTGMFIFDLANPAAPAPQGSFSHARRCDPVVADGDFAFVTLRGGQNSMCGGNSNQLDVVNVANVNAPALVRTYPLSGPYGLSKSGNLLFVCDGKDGLKVYDASSPADLKQKQTIGGVGAAFDVIAHNNIALVVSSDGLFQYDYSNPADIKFISKISLSN